MDVKALQAKDVAEKVLFGELFILDVRNEADYEDWKIEGNKFLLLIDLTLTC